ncbi:MAG TPA: hypothetical protein VMH05_10115 [Bryobacteraceae bacterium]|nr:hypothetical protein [Bryobacteraceae bacterium]
MSVRAPRVLKPYILLFAGLTAVYHSNMRPIPSGDSLCTSLVPLSILLDHSVLLDRFGPWLFSHVPYTREVIRFKGGHYYSGYPIAGGVLVTPLYLPLLAVPGLRDWNPGSLVVLARILEKFAASAIAAFSAVVMLALLLRLTSRYWAWRLTLAYALATATWSIASQALWQHTTVELAIVGSLYFLEAWWRNRESAGALWLCGACAACALMIRPGEVVLLAALAAGILVARARLLDYVRLFALPALGGLLALAYNLYFFSNPTGTYTFGMWAGSALKGVAGLLVSPARGLLIYMPIAVFALCAFLPAASDARRKHAPLLVASGTLLVLHFLVVSRVNLWWGGYCWGPRYLTEIMPLLVILMALGSAELERPWVKRSLAVVAIYCVLIQAVGVYFYPNGHWDNTPVSVDRAGYRVWDWRDNPIRRTLDAGPLWQPYVIVATAVTAGLPAASRKMRELGVHLY